ncbi:MAG: hypothetical protein E5W72_01920 [Mesorhizobium sp.]|nr:MAG: hypothetical protein E5W87_24845 [Mesorhizobium sp.]TIT54888.1 MAG: hypothetical protein E5W72_01920 [Mesorhizobium sp.]
MREVRGFRPDIQGLRGLAVALVMVFHLWPDVLPGGYVGVDVWRSWVPTQKRTTGRSRWCSLDSL